jgi:hypothetical protein
VVEDRPSGIFAVTAKYDRLHALRGAVTLTSTGFGCVEASVTQRLYLLRWIGE